MIRFQGVETLPVPPDAAFDRLADAGWLAAALPDAQVTSAGPDAASWRVKPKFAFMAGVLDTEAVVSGREPGRQVRYTVVSKGVGSSSTVQAVLTFAPADGGSSVEWAADVTELGGLLKLAPRGLIQAAAQTVIGEVWAAVRRKLADG
jgi:carbon monoxide dehydrogenase subunit G